MSQDVPSQSENARITSLLDNAVLARLERMRLNSRSKFTNRQQGEHLAGKRGSSNEFADYRNYTEGDDIRRVDWNIFGRLRKPYIKLFYEEQEKHVAVIIDNSSSMGFGNKFDRARELAAAFSFMGLMGGERVSLFASNPPEGGRLYQRPLRGRGNFHQVTEFLEGLECGGQVPLETAINDFMKHHRGQGIAVIVSDFMTFGDMRGGLNRIFNGGLEIFGLQVLAPEELDPELNGDLRLLDSESERRLDVSITETLLRVYHEYRNNLEQELTALCSQRAGRYMPVDASLPLHTVLFDNLRRKGWIR